MMLIGHKYVHIYVSEVGTGGKGRSTIVAEAYVLPGDIVPRATTF
jgi:hypothetical protein